MSWAECDTTPKASLLVRRIGETQCLKPFFVSEGCILLIIWSDNPKYRNGRLLVKFCILVCKDKYWWDRQLAGSS